MSQSYSKMLSIRTCLKKNVAFEGLCLLANHLNKDLPLEALIPDEELLISAKIFTDDLRRIVEDDESTMMDKKFQKIQNTRFSGVFYLINLLLELNIGQHLWEACIEEGSFLGWGANKLVDDNFIGMYFGKTNATDPIVKKLSS